MDRVVGRTDAFRSVEFKIWRNKSVSRRKHSTESKEVDSSLTIRKTFRHPSACSTARRGPFAEVAIFHCTKKLIGVPDNLKTSYVHYIPGFLQNIRSTRGAIPIKTPT